MDGFMHWAYENQITKQQKQCNPITVQTVLHAHTVQLSDDDPTMGLFNSASYKRAILSAIEGNENFQKKQAEHVKFISSLSKMNICSVPKSSLPEIVRNKRKRTAGAKGDEIYRAASLSEVLSESIDDTLGFYRVSAVSVGEKELKAQWDGQFLVRINPRRRSLEILMMKFVPEFDSKDAHSLENNNVTRSLKRTMRKNLCRYEMSRQFSLQVLLSFASEFYLCTPKDNTRDAAIVLGLKDELDVQVALEFSQRHTLTNLPHKWNKWSTRSDFFEGKPSKSVPFRISFSGNYKDLAQLTAKALNDSALLLDAYKRGETTSLAPYFPVPVPPKKAGCKTFEPQQEPTTSASKKPRRIVGKKNRLRRDILDALVELKLIKKQKAKDILEYPENAEDDTFQHPSKTNNYLAGLGLHPCFEDYVNFRCTSAEDMLHLLQQPIQASDYCLDHRAFGLQEEHEHLDLDTMTSAKLLKLQKKLKLEVFYSFCMKEINTSMNTFHCSRCHQCAEWREWHCKNCDRCSYGFTIPKCGHCGNNAARGEPKVKPALEKRCMLKKLVGMFEVSDFSRTAPTPDDYRFLMLESDQSSSEDEGDDDCTEDQTHCRELTEEASESSVYTEDSADSDDGLSSSDSQIGEPSKKKRMASDESFGSEDLLPLSVLEKKSVPDKTVSALINTKCENLESDESIESEDRVPLTVLKENLPGKHSHVHAASSNHRKNRGNNVGKENEVYRPSKEGDDESSKGEKEHRIKAVFGYKTQKIIQPKVDDYSRNNKKEFSETSTENTPECEELLAGKQQSSVVSVCEEDFSSSDECQFDPFFEAFSTKWSKSGQHRVQKPCTESYDERGWHFSDEDDDIFHVSVNV